MVETTSFLAKLTFRCPYCDLKYFSTTHLYKNCLDNKKIKVCKLCNEQIDADNSSDLVDYYSFNEAIERSSLQNKQYEWWKDEESYLDIDKP